MSLAADAESFDLGAFAQRARASAELSLPPEAFTEGVMFLEAVGRYVLRQQVRPDHEWNPDWSRTALDDLSRTIAKACMAADVGVPHSFLGLALELTFCPYCEPETPTDGEADPRRFLLDGMVQRLVARVTAARAFVCGLPPVIDAHKSDRDVDALVRAFDEITALLSASGLSHPELPLFWFGMTELVAAMGGNVGALGDVELDDVDVVPTDDQLRALAAAALTPFSAR